MRLLCKRTLDIALASAGLLVLSPILALTALGIALSLGPPVLFRQTRAGLRERPFVIYKFRTMASKRDEAGRLLPDEQRLTRIGRIVRGASFDELPQLWNVLRGDMSLVGPRPLLVDYLERYSPRQRRRHEVRPGITGWAQIHGRNALSWTQKLEFDMWYVENQSLCLDLRILAVTFAKVLHRDGVTHPGFVTMPEFHGSSDPESNI